MELNNKLGPLPLLKEKLETEYTKKDKNKVGVVIVLIFARHQ